jgi:hypothetical protein
MRISWQMVPQQASEAVSKQLDVLLDQFQAAMQHYANDATTVVWPSRCSLRLIQKKQEKYLSEWQSLKSSS